MAFYCLFRKKKENRKEVLNKNTDKKDYREHFKRETAGAKGVGRFSCDRLGAKVNLKSKIDIVNIGLHFFLKDVRPMLPPVMNRSIVDA